MSGNTKKLRGILCEFSNDIHSAILIPTYFLLSAIARKTNIIDNLQNMYQIHCRKLPLPFGGRLFPHDCQE